MHSAAAWIWSSQLSQTTFDLLNTATKRSDTALAL
jgi:hypothetical protein